MPDDDQASEPAPPTTARTDSSSARSGDGTQSTGSPSKGVELSKLAISKELGPSLDVDRRRKIILSGRHPDTGRPLRATDKGSLRAEDRLWFNEWHSQRIDAVLKPQTDATLDKKIAEIRRRTEASFHPIPSVLTRAQKPGLGLIDPNHEAVLRAIRAVNPLDKQLLHSLSPSEQVNRHVAPLGDVTFVQRMSGVIGGNISALRDPHLIDQIYKTAEERITERLKAEAAISRNWSRSAELHDIGNIAREAQRILAVYGPRIAEQPRFLSEYQANLAIFPDAGRRGIEQAELLARSYLPDDLHRPWEVYSEVSRRNVRLYYRAAIKSLRADFARERNPVHAWEAIAISFRERFPFAAWLREFLGETATSIVDILDEVAAGAPAGKEAERVGKVLGFGVRGPGRGGWFEQASVLRRDRGLVSDIEEWMSSEARPGRRPKLTNAYDAIAAKHGVGVSTVRGARSRIQGLRKG
jgi:hypothetical protein